MAIYALRISILILKNNAKLCRKVKKQTFIYILALLFGKLSRTLKKFINTNQSILYFLSPKLFQLYGHY